MAQIITGAALAHKPSRTNSFNGSYILLISTVLIGFDTVINSGIANLLYNNDKKDLFIELNHGPYILDNNMLLSAEAILSQSRGGAYIHNLVRGKIPGLLQTCHLGKRNESLVTTTI